MRTHPLATAAIAIAASAALLAAAFVGSPWLATLLAIALVVPVSTVVAGRFLRGAGAVRPPRDVATPPTTVNEPAHDDAVVSATTMLGGFLAAVMIIVAGGIVGLAVHGDLDHSAMGGGGHMEFMLDGVPTDIAAHYGFARDHRGPYAMVPCYCGCEATLDHRHLYDCFVRPDGAWESHASGCAVCIDESKIVRRMLVTGAQPDEIRDAIVARYEALIPS